MMLLNSLFDKVLINPVDRGCSELFVVSGYASATFANRHLSASTEFKMNLIIGMPGRRADHLGFISLYEKYEGRFKGFYLNSYPPVHSKVYAWYNEAGPIEGFSGSANYSQSGFTSTQQINQLTQEDPEEIRIFYDSLLSRSVEIKDFQFDQTEYDSYLKISGQTASHLDSPLQTLHDPVINGRVLPGQINWELMDERVTISFLDRSGNVPQRSGLNWGQRLNREPNQAYLSLKKDSRKDGFLPPIGETFTLVTDDNVAMDCCVAQQGRKAIHSTLDNSEIGRYIRNRIGKPLGELITLNDLEKYGRTDFTIQKVNSETFYFDMSVPLKKSDASKSVLAL